MTRADSLKEKQLMELHSSILEFIKSELVKFESTQITRLT